MKQPKKPTDNTKPNAITSLAIRAAAFAATTGLMTTLLFFGGGDPKLPPYLGD